MTLTHTATPSQAPKSSSIATHKPYHSQGMPGYPNHMSPPEGGAYIPHLYPPYGTPYPAMMYPPGGMWGAMPPPATGVYNLHSKYDMLSTAQSTNDHHAQAVATLHRGTPQRQSNPAPRPPHDRPTTACRSPLRALLPSRHAPIRDDGLWRPHAPTPRAPPKRPSPRQGATLHPTPAWQRTQPHVAHRPPARVPLCRWRALSTI